MIYGPSEFVGHRVWLGLLTSLLLASSGLTAEIQSMSLRQGVEQTASLTLADPKSDTLLWVRGRIVLPEGEQLGAHALALSLNGVRLAPNTVTALNKQSVSDQPGVVTEDPARPRVKTIPAPGALALFDPQTGGWYLKADSDDYPFNLHGEPGALYSSMGGRLPEVVPNPNLSMVSLENRQALVSHYYEYLFAVRDKLFAKRNTLTAVAKLPKRLAGYPVQVSFAAMQPKNGVVTYHRPTVDEFTHVWQAPSPADLVDDKNGLSIAASPGEFEPTSVTLFSLEALEQVQMSVEALTARDGAHRAIPASAMQCYYIALRYNRGVRFPFVANNPCPDLLIRMNEKPVAADYPVGIPFNYRTDRKDKEKIVAAVARSRELEEMPGIPVAAGTSQRFVVDVEVPADQPPGTYRGAIVLRAGDRVLRRLPLTLTVRPIRLRQPRQKYWMWRQTWTEITEPSSIQQLKMIGDSGIYGICRLAGMGLKVSYDKKTGELVFDDSQLKAGKRILQDAGLSLSYSNNSIVNSIYHLVCRNKYGIRPGSAQWFGYKLLPDLADSRLNPKAYRANPRDPSEAETAKMRQQLPEIKNDIVAILKLVRKKYDALGLDPWVFPYDEPDGTAWCHPWVKFNSELARRSGFKTWSSHNDPLGWPSGIDYSVMGGRLITAYVPMKIHTAAFQGAMGSRGIPTMGNFKGKLDEACVYNRPLSDQEILRQHVRPATQGRLAYYPFEEGRGTRLVNAAGNKAFDLTLSGGDYAKWTDGVRGKALQFEFPNQGAGEIDPKSGRAIPTPAAAAPSAAVLQGKVEIPGRGWSISYWYSGRGAVLGLPGDTLNVSAGRHGPRVQLQTIAPGEEAPSSVVLPSARGNGPEYFWAHVTISVDEENGVIKYYLYNQALRDYYRKNMKWNYSQYRGFHPIACRVQAAYATWHMRDLENMTVFVLDLNAGATNLAWPEGGDRAFNRPNTRWYPELGLLALREGIGDARYANTLYQLHRAKSGEAAAWKKIESILPGKQVNWRETYYEPILQGLSYDDVRQRLVQGILAETGK